MKLFQHGSFIRLYRMIAVEQTIIGIPLHPVASPSGRFPAPCLESENNKTTP